MSNEERLECWKCGKFISENLCYGCEVFEGIMEGAPRIQILEMLRTTKGGYC